VAAPRPSVRLYVTAGAALGDEHWAGHVTEADRAALADSARPRRRAEHLAGRALLRIALQDWTGRPAVSHVVRAGASGKPECVGGPEISVSHSRGLVVCALAPEGRIGVDVELPVSGRAIDGIADRYFSADERHWIGSRPERFHMLWVLKEAYLKALGLGLAGGLDALRCEIAPPRIEAIVESSGDAPALALYEVADGFVGIATLGCRLETVTAQRWAPDAPLRAAPLKLVAKTAN
jgi:phosphopantetheinyl transferase